MEIHPEDMYENKGPPIQEVDWVKKPIGTTQSYHS